VYGNTSGTNTGASSDIKSARYYMRSALNEYAMGEKFYAPWTDEEIENRMREEYRRTCDMVREHREVLDALTDRLLQQKSMDQTQLEEFFTEVGI
jgi:ATP-dependent Zn protease